MKAITGIQPTNTLHIGNLFGAVLPAVQMQNDYDLLMMIADLHAITDQKTLQNPTALRKNILFLTAAYLAAGIDPEKTTLFQQSQISAHNELGWIFTCLTSMSDLENMTQYKDKNKDKKILRPWTGLFIYPTLMAADILLYDSQVVPIGEDQKQHLELTKHLAEKFNYFYNTTFIIPKPIIQKEGARILGLDDPAKKMSKSAASAKNYISITDDADTIVKKIKAAVTDSISGITLDDARPGLKNLLTIFSLSSGESRESITERFANKGMKDLKDATAEALIDFLTPIQQKMTTLLADETALIEIINRGSDQAKTIATAKIKMVKEKMGLVL